jgi:crotonobetaine/carnitine-CoA ligase
MRYGGLSDPSRWVLPLALEEHAEKSPDSLWILSTDGGRLTFGQAAQDARKVAGYFSALGVGHGDRVAVMLPSCCDYVRIWQGLGMLGAVAVLLNTELRGAFLRHQLQTSGAEMIVVHHSLLQEVETLAAGIPALRQIMVVGDPSEPTSSGITRLDWAAWQDAAPYRGDLPRPQDIALIMYTSGTSGPAKGVLMPHAHLTLFGIGTIDAMGLNENDRYYTALPLFHANGLLEQVAATLLLGITDVLRPRFSAAAWLEDIRTFGATVTNVLGVMAQYVVAQAPSDKDRDHQLRAILMAPYVPEIDSVFRHRFGVADILSGFGMTESNICVLGKVAERQGPGAPVYDKYFEVIVADPETDVAVPPGHLGEILVRPKQPFAFMAGYDGMPDKTVEAWRNLWFHTGDAGVRDADGNVAFVDRIKDCIRRRAENISASDVEAALANIPGISEVAAFAVPSEIPGGEDEVMLAFVLKPGAILSAAELGDMAEPLLPRFARPRYVELMDELPKTATGKIQRALLRKRGPAKALDRGA